MSFIKAPIRSTPESKNINQRSNSFVINKSQSPQNRDPYLSYAPKPKYVHPSDPILQIPQYQPNQNQKNAAPRNTLWESNQMSTVNQMINVRGRSQSPHIGKENNVASRQSYKAIQPSPPHGLDKNQQQLKDRVGTLEKQVTGYMSENKQLTKVLDQQIQINQSLKEQLRVKTLELQNIEWQKSSSQQVQFSDKLESGELKSIMDQLQIYKQIVESLEIKIHNVVSENSRLNEFLEQNQLDNDHLKKQILIEKSRGISFQEPRNFDQSIKWNSGRDSQLKIENSMLKQKTESMEQEIQEMRNHIEMFKQHIIGIKGALTPGSDRKLQIELEERNQDNQQLANEINQMKHLFNQKENQVKYLDQINNLNLQKLRNVEQKLQILEEENKLLKGCFN